MCFILKSLLCIHKQRVYIMNRTQFSSLISKGDKKMYGKKTMVKPKVKKIKPKKKMAKKYGK